MNKWTFRNGQLIVIYKSWVIWLNSIFTFFYSFEGQNYEKCFVPYLKENLETWHCNYSYMAFNTSKFIFMLCSIKMRHLLYLTATYHQHWNHIWLNFDFFLKSQIQILYYCTWKLTLVIKFNYSKYFGKSTQKPAAVILSAFCPIFKRI